MAIDGNGREKKMPPPRKKGRGGGEMVGEDPSTYDRLSQLASQGGGEEMGGGQDMMGGGGGEEASQMFMQGVQMMAQAAQSDPRLQPILEQVLPILQQGIEGMVGGEGSQPQQPTGTEGKGKGKRERPPELESMEQPY